MSTRQADTGRGWPAMAPDPPVCKNAPNMDRLRTGLYETERSELRPPTLLIAADALPPLGCHLYKAGRLWTENPLMSC